MGEFIQFHDPALFNAMRKWVRKNHSRLMFAESLNSLTEHEAIWISAKARL
jgi:hypothetical protein